MSRHGAWRQHLLVAVLLLVVAWATAADAGNDDYAKVVRPFINQYCLRCHGPDVQRAKLRLDLRPELTGKEMRQQWESGWTVIASGEMPPKQEPAPTVAAMTPVLDWIRQQVGAAEVAANGFSAGGNGLRRLTAREQVRLWTGLLGLEWRNFQPDFVKHLAKDLRSEHFINRGEVLQMQDEHVSRALDFSERMLELFWPDTSASPPRTWTIDAKSMLSESKYQAAFQERGSLDQVVLLRAADGVVGDDRAAGLEIRPVCRPHADGSGLVLQPNWNRDVPGRAKFEHIVLRTIAPVERGILRLVIRARSELTAGETVLPTLWVDHFYGGSGQHLKFTVTDEGALPYHTICRFGRIAVPTASTELVIEVPLEYSGVDFSTVNHSPLPGLWLLLRNLPIPAQPPVKQYDRIQPAGDSTRNPIGPTEKTETTVAKKGEAKYPPGSTIVIERITCTVRSQDEETMARRRQLIGTGSLSDLRTFAEHAWGRPVAEAEVAPMAALSAANTAQLGAAGAWRLAAGAILTAPDCIYLFDRRADERLAQIDLSRRLAMTLWGEVPDAHLRTLAASGRLDEETVLRSELERMLADKRLSWLCQEFCRQWLGLEDLNDLEATWAIGGDGSSMARNQAIRRDLGEEPGRFLHDAIVRRRSLSHLVAPDQVILSGALATFYGAPCVGGGWLPVKAEDLPATRRGGFMTMAGPIAVASRGQQEAEIYRGTYLLSRILGIELGTPPANVPTLESRNADKTFSKMKPRKKLEIHTRERTCAVCHQRIDPMGFVWDQYDRFGKERRAKDGSLLKADEAGCLPNGRSFADFAAMRREMLANPRSRGSFPRAMVQALTSYLIGRSLTIADESRIDRLLDDGDPLIHDLIISIIVDDTVRKKYDRKE